MKIRALSLVVSLALLQPMLARADELVVNGSFEEGAESPAGWAAEQGGRWVTDAMAAHQGQRFLTGSRSAAGAVWHSEPIQLQQGIEYRLEGWLFCRSGKAWIEVAVADAQAIAQPAATPPVVPGVNWQYVALDLAAGDARTLRIAFHVAGESKVPGDADLDQLSLVPVAVSFMGNKGVEKDGRGRLGFWDEEKAELLPGTQRSGTRTFDDQEKREGRSSIVLKPQSPEHWFAASTVNYPIPAWTDRFRFTGWARCSEKASARLAACWANNKQEVLRIDVGPASQSSTWQQIEWQPPAPPADAATVRFSAVAQGGDVWFDDFDAQTLLPQQPQIKVWVNQVGYETLGPKSAVVATNFFPREDATVLCEIVGENNRGVDRRRVGCMGRIHAGTLDDWGWYLWRLDFSPFRMPGRFLIRASTTTAAGKTQSVAASPRFIVGSDVLFNETVGLGVEFFFVQRCGCEVPGWHGPCHLDDAKLPDGTHIDVTGGWHSAGDYNKPMWQFGDSAAVYALAAVFDRHRDVLSRADRDGDGTPDALDEALWGARFLAKMQNPEDGSLRGDVNQGPKRDWMRWTAPDVHTDNKIGTADDPVIAQPVGNTPLAVAGWARLAPLLAGRNVASDYLERAARLWDYYAKQQSAVENSLLLFGAVEMHAATGEARYKEFADRAVEALLKSQRPDGSFSGDSGDHGDWAVAALATYALKYPAAPQREPLRAGLRKYLEFCLSRADNAFGVSRQGDSAGKQLYFHPSVGLGVNFWLLGRAWAAALIHQLTGDPRALTYAVDQIDWVFGKNPAGLCMFEGKGAFNPPRYHHRYNMIAGKERGAVPGAIPNGFVTEMGLADRAGFDFSAAGNRAPSFRTSEPWLVHNIVHLLAVSALPTSSAAASK